MASPEYWLDTSALIESKKRWYRFDVVPGFWSFIDSKVSDGVICSPVAVYDELVKRTDDDLAAWAKERKGMPFFMDPSQAVQGSLNDIANYVNSEYGSVKAANDFLDGADPWMVAYARVHGGTVITLETGAVAGRTPRVKLPIVCDYFEVAWDSLFEMLDHLGMRLSG